MSSLLRIGLATALAALAVGQGAANAQSASPFGVWQNPKNSVHVELRPCGDSACGYVVWASEKAQAKARKGGVETLIGLQLFRDMAPDGDGAWKGSVFVPDLNRTVAGRAQALDNERLKAKGCLVAGVLCKSQIWTRTS